VKNEAYNRIQTSLVSLLLVLYVASIFQSYTPFLDYALNYNYISKVLCVNKDKVGSCCKGKCHLKSQLKKSADKEDTDNGRTTHPTQNGAEYDLVHLTDWSLQLFSQARERKGLVNMDLYSFCASSLHGPPPKPKV
jgi:hypothetical protein